MLHDSFTESRYTITFPYWIKKQQGALPRSEHYSAITRQMQKNFFLNIAYLLIFMLLVL